MSLRNDTSNLLLQNGVNKPFENQATKKSPSCNMSCIQYVYNKEISEQERFA